MLALLPPTVKVTVLFAAFCRSRLPLPDRPPSDGAVTPPANVRPLFTPTLTVLFCKAWAAARLIVPLLIVAVPVKALAELASVSVPAPSLFRPAVLLAARMPL